MASAILDRARARAVLPAAVRLIVEPSPETRARIPADEAALAVYCLIENAVDAIATNGGGGRHRPPPRARRSRPGRHRGRRRSGPGFAVGALDRALEPYFTTRQAQIGIGLNIARRIATRWRGKLAIEVLPRGVRTALVLEVVR